MGLVALSPNFGIALVLVLYDKVPNEVKFSLRQDLCLISCNLLLVALLCWPRLCVTKMALCIIFGTEIVPIGSYNLTSFLSIFNWWLFLFLSHRFFHLTPHLTISGIVLTNTSNAITIKEEVTLLFEILVGSLKPRSCLRIRKAPNMLPRISPKKRKSLLKVSYITVAQFSVTLGQLLER